jgi:BirA family biotin operon repressor/biotin-[acetyl-CoA-carboxylase] ligase
MAVSTAIDLDVPSLLKLLADGRLHSGEELAGALGVSRAAVWKAARRLRLRGIDIAALPRRGYRLPQPVELLDPSVIRAVLKSSSASHLARLAVKFEVDSTNSRLLASAAPAPGSAEVLLSELQHAGRGRRGRQWSTPFGGGIALSMGWTFHDAALASPALSLCVGVAVSRGLIRAGAHGIGLKWPNDLWFEDRKVGGVLIEMRAEAGGPAHVVIGIGINVNLAPEARVRLEASGQAVAAVADACPAPPARNFIAGAIIDELLVMLVEFERDGFAAFRDRWLALDVLRGRPAQVWIGGTAIGGTARGVDARGALLLERDGRLHEYTSGEVSLRLGGDAI